jgi:hypothetical protein
MPALGAGGCGNAGPRSSVALGRTALLSNVSALERQDPGKRPVRSSDEIGSKTSGDRFESSMPSQPESSRQGCSQFRVNPRHFGRLGPVTRYRITQVSRRTKGFDLASSRQVSATRLWSSFFNFHFRHSQTGSRTGRAQFADGGYDDHVQASVIRLVSTRAGPHTRRPALCSACGSS